VRDHDVGDPVLERGIVSIAKRTFTPLLRDPKLALCHLATPPHHRSIGPTAGNITDMVPPMPCPRGAAKRTPCAWVMTLLVREEELLAANLDYHVRQGVEFAYPLDGARQATVSSTCDGSR
jgi:hypothetical protein